MGLKESFEKVLPVVAFITGVGGASVAVAQDHQDPSFGKDRVEDVRGVLGSPDGGDDDPDKLKYLDRILRGIDCSVDIKVDDEDDLTDLQLLEILKCKELKSVKFKDGTAMIITLADDMEVVVSVSVSFGEDLHKFLLEKGVDMTHSNTASSELTSSLLSSLMIFVMFLGSLYFLKKRGGNKHVPLHTMPDVVFEDIGGLGNVKGELVKLVEEIQNREELLDEDVDVPKGVLFTGPTGSGKTLAARAVATEAGVPFIYVSASELISKWVGETSKAIRQIFQRAEKIADKEGACIVFIDELDSIGAARSNDDTAAGKGYNSDVNQLLVCMDGFEESDGVVVIGATNFRDRLDSALTRTGRFSREVYFNYPDQAGRLEILGIYLEGVELSDDVRLETLASSLVGKSGSDVKNIVQEAKLLALKRRGSPIVLEQKDLTDAMDRALLGVESDHKLTDAEKIRTAIHEAGHTVTALASPNSTVERVSIVPRGASLGVTLTPPMEEKLLNTKTDLEWQLMLLLAGGLAEKLELKEGSSGIVDDHRKATEIATAMVAELGMFSDGDEEELSPFRFYPKDSNVDLDRLSRMIDKLLARCGGRASKVLAQNATLLKIIQNRLMEDSTIEHDELIRLFQEHGTKDIEF